MSSTKPEIQAIKDRMRSTWMAGDFGQIAQHSAEGASEFISRLSIKPGDKVLDVACGTGNLSIPAAKRGADVTGVDIAPNLVEQARRRADQEGLKIKFDEGDAEQLPYADGSFDWVVTMFGAMFAPRPDQTAAELTRVCRSGGQIAMANWTAEGFIGQTFKIVGKYAPPPQGLASPLLWGDEKTIRDRLRYGIAHLRLTRRMIRLAYPFDEAAVVEFFRRYFGPIQRAFEGLDETGQVNLRRDLETAWKENNQVSDGSTQVDGEYLEVIAQVA
jgi:ubiquinone/menaquinone biosynthesis C-methylase UbiE